VITGPYRCGRWAISRIPRGMSHLRSKCASHGAERQFCVGADILALVVLQKYPPGRTIEPTGETSRSRQLVWLAGEPVGGTTLRSISFAGLGGAGRGCGDRENLDTTYGCQL